LPQNSYQTFMHQSCLSYTNHQNMGLFKTALLGAVVYGAVKYLTKKDPNGRSIVDDIKDRAPEWMEKAKSIKNDIKVELERQRY